MIKKFLLLVIMTYTLAACSDESVDITSTVDTKDWVFDQNMDTIYRPGDNFFMFCNGTWYNKADLGGNKRIGLVYSEAGNIVDKRVAKLNNIQIKKFYSDAEQIDLTTESAIRAIQKNLEITKNIKTKEEAWEAIAKTMQMGYGAFLGIQPYSRGGKMYLTFKSTFKFDNEEWIIYCFRKLGMTENEVRERIDRITQIYKRSKLFSKVDLSQTNLMKHPELHDAIFPLRNTRTDNGTSLINKIAEVFGINKDDIFIHEGIEDYLSLIQNSDVLTIQTILEKEIADDVIYSSHEAIADYNKMNNKKYTLDSLTNRVRKDYMGYLYSYAYVTQYVTSEQKEQFKEISEELRRTFDERISIIDWMSESTKQNAREKLAAMKFNIGYPDQWIEEGLAKLTGSSLAENIMQLRAVNFSLQKSFIGKNSQDVSFDYIITNDADLTEVNAFYNPLSNSMNIYPAFMLEPFYQRSLSDAYNYAVFAVIGHEMTHGFDSRGSLYNKLGDKDDWWTVTDKMDFIDRQQKLINCYDMLELMPKELPGVYGDGSKTLAENIADLGGLEIAHQAYVTNLKKEGYRGDELVKQEKKFYQAFAELWRSKCTAEWAKTSREKDEHSLGKERVNGVVMNCDRWYELYNVKWGDKLYLKPERRTYIW